MEKGEKKVGWGGGGGGVPLQPLMALPALSGGASKRAEELAEKTPIASSPWPFSSAGSAHEHSTLNLAKPIFNP